MKTSLPTMTISFILLSSSFAYAEDMRTINEEANETADQASDNAYVSTLTAKDIQATAQRNKERYRFLGFGFDVGVPDGVALGIVGRVPAVPWAKLELAFTHDVIAPGLRGSLTLDPIKFPIVPTLSFDLGHQFEGTVPGVDKSPKIEYTYLNLQPGLEFGSRDGFRFLLRAGMSWVNGSVGNFNSIVSSGNGVSFGDPSFHAQFAPSAKIGFQWLL